MPRRGKTIGLITAGLALACGVGLIAASWRTIVEEWQLHRLGSESGDVCRDAAAALARMRCVRAVPEMVEAVVAGRLQFDEVETFLDWMDGAGDDGLLLARQRGDAETRIQVVRLLAHRSRTSDRAHRELWCALEDEDRDVQAALIDDLGRLPGKPLTERMLEQVEAFVLDDARDLADRDRVANWLASYDRRASRVLLEGLRRPGVETRVVVSEAFIVYVMEFKSMPEEALPILEMALDDANGIVRFNCLRVLGSIRPRASVLPHLRRILERPASSDDTVAAVRVLEALGPDAAPLVPLLIGLLAASSRDRQAAMSALQAIGPAASAAVPSLLGLLRDPVPPDDDEALAALESIDPANLEVVPLLLRIAASNPHAFGREARRALQRRGTRALPWLIQSLSEPGSAVALRAAEVLGDLGPAAGPAVLALRTALASDDIDLVAEAALALGRIGATARQAAPAILARLELLTAELEDGGALHRALVAGLGRLGVAEERTLPLLRRAAQSRDEELCAEACLALGRLGASDAPTSSALRTALADPDALVRAAAAVALARGTPSERERLQAVAVQACEDPATCLALLEATRGVADEVQFLRPALAAATASEYEPLAVAAREALSNLTAGPTGSP